MSKPIHFKQANTVWKGWPKDEQREEVLDLPAFKKDSLTISAWKMTWRERLKALFSGVLWLHVHGQHPPVYVSSDYPFMGRN